MLQPGGGAAIAKFPSPSDEWDVIRWEAIAMRLARQAGIDVADSSVHLVDGKPVLVLERFDRVGTLRVGYVSALTMLEQSDRDDGGSYLDIVDAIERSSPQVDRDLAQLWRRVAFSVLISNTDDHLRNHGFLRTSSSGWTVSPAFDLNPNPAPGPKFLSTAIDFDERLASVETLLGVAEYFRLTDEDASRVLGQVVHAVSGWRSLAKDAGLDAAELDRMAPAFEHDQGARAAQLVADLPA